jgi:hypothetical protein
MEFVSGKPLQPEAEPRRQFRGQVIYMTRADVTVRRRSGAIVVIDQYEIVAISDSKTRLEQSS